MSDDKSEDGEPGGIYRLGGEMGKYGVKGSDAGATTTGWVYIHDGKQRYDDALRQVIDGSSDRAAGIVAGAFIDDHLTLAIKRRLVNDNEVLPSLMPVDGGGVLGDFRTKINVAFLMGLLSVEARRELSWIAKIRNSFAHKLEVRSFSDQPVTDWCANLTKWESGVIAGRGGLVVQSGMTITGLQVREDGISISSSAPAPDTKISSRDRYLGATKYYLAALTLLVNEARSPETPRV